MRKPAIPLLCVALCLAALIACTPSSVSLSRFLNIARIETEFHEDGSGYNNLWLVVPSSSACPLPDLKPALDSITIPTKPTVTLLSDQNYTGYIVTFAFENANQIPAQIQTLKDVVVRAVIAATPTPLPPENPETPMPAFVTPKPVAYYNENQLSIKFAALTTGLTGKTWSLQVIINPFVMSGIIQEQYMAGSGLAEQCSIPTFTYKLTLSDKMKIRDFAVESRPDLAPFSSVKRISDNSIEWTLNSKQAFTAAITNLVASVTAMPDPDPTALASEVEYLYNGQIYKLMVNATTPNIWFSYLVQVVAPLVALLGGVLGVVAAIRNLRKKKEA